MEQLLDCSAPATAIDRSPERDQVCAVREEAARRSHDDRRRVFQVGRITSLRVLNTNPKPAGRAERTRARLIEKSSRALR